MKPWEDMLALNNFEDTAFQVLPAASSYYEPSEFPASWQSVIFDHLPSGLLEAALTNDQHPLPSTKDREGYWGKHHFGYWASGLRDYQLILDCCEELGIDAKAYLDFGCASGRVVRHFAANQPEMQVFGCDLNRHHIEWICRYLPSNVCAFQTHSVPNIPLPDNSLDVITAYSVFTHIEAFETAWLMELRRLLKPGGIAWITVHSEHTWSEMDGSWPLYQLLSSYPGFDAKADRGPLAGDRVVFRGDGQRSYSSQVFYHFDYLDHVWGRFFEVVGKKRRHPGFQDVIILRKR
jgi:SAM-dependent methyltransferase